MKRELACLFPGKKEAQRAGPHGKDIRHVMSWTVQILHSSPEADKSNLPSLDRQRALTELRCPRLSRL